MASGNPFITCPLHVAQEIRRDWQHFGTSVFYTHQSACGEATVSAATGRARCRCCGEKIEKGAEAIKFFEDHGLGTWTARWVYIHAETCPRQLTTTP